MSCSVQTKIHFIQRQINLYTELDEIGPAFEHGDLEDVTVEVRSREYKGQALG
jgi:hypothetical protein